MGVFTTGPPYEDMLNCGRSIRVWRGRWGRCVTGDCARADAVSGARARGYFRECSDVLSDYW